MKSIAERLIFLRGDTARRPFAEQIGVTESTLRNYEQGTSSPNADTLETVCKKLRISPEWLVMGTGPMRSKDHQGGASEPTKREELNAPPIPEDASISLHILFSIVEALEEVLQESRKTLHPTVKAEVVCQLCRLVTEDKQQNLRPAQVFRLIRGALAANE